MTTYVMNFTALRGQCKMDPVQPILDSLHGHDWKSSNEKVIYGLVFRLHSIENGVARVFVCDLDSNYEPSEDEKKNLDLFDSK